MTQTAQQFLTKIEEAATALGDQAAREFIQTMCSQMPSGNLKLLVVGATGTGRCSIINALLGRPKLLPISTLPKAPITIIVSHGPTIRVEAMSTDGLTDTLSEAKLRALLTSSESSPGKYHSIHITADADCLQTSDIRIESLDAERTPEQWKQVMAGIDYAIVILKATAILSEVERRFFKEVLGPYFGLERVAIVINQMDLIPADECESVEALVRTFLGAFSAQSPIMPVSTPPARITAGAGSVHSRRRDLIRFMRDDLLECAGKLKSAAMRQIAEMCLAELSTGAARQAKLLELSASQLQTLRERSRIESEWVQQRVQRAQNRGALFVGSVLKEHFLREVEGFGQALRSHVSAEATQLNDAELVRKHLGGYMEALWRAFLADQMRDVQAKVEAESNAVGQIVADDLSDLLGEQAVNFGDVLEGLDLTRMNAHAGLMPRRSQHEGSRLSTGMSLGGLAITILGGGAALPMGATLVFAGHILRQLQNRGIDAAETGAVIEAAVAAAREVEREIKRQVVDQFDALTDKLRAGIVEIYQRVMDSVRPALDEASQRSAQLAARREQLEVFQRRMLPELYALLETSAWQRFSPAVSNRATLSTESDDPGPNRGAFL
jgi:hypothetical protein